MKSFDSTTLALLASGRLAKRDLLLFSLPDGDHGFWTGLGILPFNSVNYVGAGELVSIQPLTQTMDLSSMPVLVELTSIPNSALTPDVLATVESEQYHQQPAVLSTAYINPDTRAVVSVQRWYRGYIDKIEHQDQVGGQAVLSCNLESKSRDHLKKGYRTRSDADQRLINVNDGGLSFSAVAGQQQIIWGQSTTSAQGQLPTLTPGMVTSALR